MISFGKGIFNKFFDFSETKHQAIKCNQLIIEYFPIFIIQEKKKKKKKKRSLPSELPS